MPPLVQYAINTAYTDMFILIVFLPVEKEVIPNDHGSS